MVMQRIDYAKVFQQKQTEWQTKAQSYNTQLQSTSKTLESAQIQYQNLQKVLQRPLASDDESTVLKFLHTLSSSYMAKNIGTNVARGASVKTFTDMNALKAQITNLSGEYEKNDFYIRLYGQAPIAISTGKINSAEDFMKRLTLPSNLTAAELSDVKATVTDMIATIKGSAQTEAADETVAGVKFPSLVPPEDTRVTPTTIHRLSVQDILKSLTAVPTPETTISDAEWRSYLMAKGYSEGDVDKEQQLEAEDLIKEWQDRNNQIAAYKEGVATMPDYKASDILKIAILQPGLAAMEAANVYFTHVTQPVAGALYSKINPDLEAEFLRFKVANPNATDREAYVAAWNTWNPEKILGWELGPTQQWILKYMIAEGLVDPTSYMGWGIAAKIFSSMGRVGRLVGAAERGFMEVMDLPFDAVKAIANNLPKSIAQRATLSSRASMQFADKYVTSSVGKGLSFVRMDEMEKAAKAAIKYTIENPQLVNTTTNAGKSFLAHTPITEDTAIRWARTLGTTLLPEDITKVTVENLDTVFEDYFTYRVLTPREASGQMLKILNIGDMSDEILAKAEGLLSRRVKSIQDDSLSFLNAKNALQAMRNLGDRNFAIHLAAEESSVYLARKQTGAVSAMIHNTDLRLQGVWQDYIDKIVIKPFAQAFLAFGMYGPMNVMEDYMRSALGGVFPRRMTVTNFDSLAIGLSIDPNMRIYGLSEMLGEVTREGSKEEFNNWILQLAALGNKGWANKIYTGLVRLPGAYGMDLRRNFVAKRYLQILADLGGDQFQTLVEALPKNTSGLDLLNKSLRKDLLNDLYARVSTGDSKIVLGAKEVFTRENIIRQEVTNVLMEHPELPPAVRQYVMQQFNEGNLFSEIAARGIKQPRDARGRFIAANDSINNTINEARGIALDDFIKGPEVASLQFSKLTEFLTALQVQNPREMASLVQSLYHMSEVYGALPEQILAQATIRSRGMKLAERRSVFDADFERINSFLDSAGVDITKVTDKLKAISSQPSLVEMPVSYEPFQQFTEAIANAADIPARSFDDVNNFITGYAKLATLGKDFPDSEIDKLIQIMKTHRGIRGEETFSKEVLAALDAADKTGTRLDKVLAIEEFAHEAHDRGSVIPQALFSGDMGKLRDMKYEDASDIIRSILKIEDPELLDELGFNVANELIPGMGFKDWEFVAFTKLDELVNNILDDLFAGNLKQIPIRTGYSDVAQRLIDTITAKKEFATEWRLLNSASRHDYFAGINRRDMNTQFWDNFYNRMSGETRALNTRMAQLDGQIVRQIEELNIASGAAQVARPPVIVRNRALAPNDIASLLGVRGDDISRGLLDVLTVQNNKEFFTNYVIAMTRPGDVGFTKEAVDAVYDQIAYSLKVSPESMSWITKRNMELDAIKKELHSLYNSKLLPPEQMEAIGKYIDDAAANVGKLTTAEAAPTTIPITPEITLYRAERLASSEKTVDFATSVKIAQLYGGKDSKIIELKLTPEELSKLSTLKLGAIGGQERIIYHVPQNLYQKAISKVGAVTPTAPVTPSATIKLAGFSTEEEVRISEILRSPIISKFASNIVDSIKFDSRAKLSSVSGRTITLAPGWDKETVIHELFHIEPEVRFIAGDKQYFLDFIDALDKDGAIADYLSVQFPKAREAISEGMALSKENPLADDTAEWLAEWFTSYAIKETSDRPMTPAIAAFYKKYYPPSVSRAAINKTEYDSLRQQAMDEAHKWYYKEFVDYTNANVFDAMMKTIYPYWTYESQRWFWLPRSFIRHPGTFTSFERWQDNSDSGYVHIPNTSIDINPFRGTVYGTLTTRLARRDYPEYYDSLGAAKGLVEFNDFLSRYGFYAGAHVGIPLAMLGGIEPQTGEILPGIIKTPLELLVSAFPKSNSVKWLSEHIFPDRFRDYTTMIVATKRGYSGIDIWTKIKENRPLTEEEQNAWDDSRQESALYGALFEQTGLFRLKTEDQYKAYQESAKAIQDMTGYTPEQQEWLRRHGYRIWDMVGGLSPSNQVILQQLESYKWIGLNTPLLPSRQQLELNRLNLDWQDIQTFSEDMKAQKLSLEQEFKNGTLGPSDFNSRLQALYDGQREYIDNKSNENPLLTLVGRVEYYKKYGVAPPVQSPFKELLNLYFSIELTDTHDSETGELITDWKSFFANRQAIEDAIPAELKDEWNTYLSRNQTPIEELRRAAFDKYFQKYYGLWDEVVSLYPADEQRLINEFLFLERTGQNLSRQEEIKSMPSAKTGNLLISSFRSEISVNRQALRYSNPHLDAWLYYWGKTKSFLTPQAERIYRQLIQQTGRRL